MAMQMAKKKKKKMADRLTNVNKILCLFWFCKIHVIQHCHWFNCSILRKECLQSTQWQGRSRTVTVGWRRVPHWRSFATCFPILSNPDLTFPPPTAIVTLRSDYDLSPLCWAHTQRLSWVTLHQMFWAQWHFSLFYCNGYRCTFFRTVK